MSEIQYISDDYNNIIGVIVPIDLWREVQSEKETAYLLKSKTMKKRLVAAKKRDDGISLEEANEDIRFIFHLQPRNMDMFHSTMTAIWSRRRERLEQ